jgi:hypothetical protein
MIENDAQVVVIHSAAGAGKISLVNTGLPRRLELSGYFVLPKARLGLPPTGLPGDSNPYEFAAHASMSVGMPRQHPLSSWNDILKSPAPPKRGPVLIIDQVEEIVNVHFGPTENKRKFFRRLAQAINENRSCRLMLVVQQEYLEQVRLLAGGFAAQWKAFHLDPLARDLAAEAIRRPAAREGVKFDPDLLKLLVDELATVRFVDALGKEIEEPGQWVEPMQLQLVCDSLWSRMPKGARLITWQEIRGALSDDARSPREAIKTFVGMALRDFCGRVIEGVARDYHYPVPLIDLGCQNFILESGGRALLHQEVRRTGDLPNDIVNALESRHLLRLESRGGERFFELAHVNLVAPIGERGAALDAARLAELWVEAITAIARSDPGAKIDPEGFVNACLKFLDRHEAAKRVPLDTFVNELSGVPRQAADALSRGHWIRISADPSFYELEHPKLAVGLARIARSREIPVRPFNLLVRIVFPCVPAVSFAILFEFVGRTLLARYQLTLTQATNSFAMAGWFQGLVGGFVWGVFVGLALSSWIFLLDARPRPVLKRNLLCAALGTTAGLLGGAIVTIAVLFGQTPTTVLSAGWITSPDSILSAFIRTRLGYTELIFGAAVGLSCALASRRLLDNLGELIRRLETPRTIPEAARISWELFSKTLRTSLPVFVPILAVSALLVHALLPVSVSRYKVIGEATSILIGGVAIVFGLVFGIVAQNWDLEIASNSLTPESRTGVS